MPPDADGPHLQAVPDAEAEVIDALIVVAVVLVPASVLVLGLVIGFKAGAAVAERRQAKEPRCPSCGCHARTVLRTQPSRYRWVGGELVAGPFGGN